VAKLSKSHEDNNLQISKRLVINDSTIISSCKITIIFGTA